jgi:predicted RNase H-like nuclease (RuvC/YqgF family)
LVAFLRSLPSDVVSGGEGPAAVKLLRREGYHRETEHFKRGVEDMAPRIDEMKREIEQLRRDLEQLRDQVNSLLMQTL